MWGAPPLPHQLLKHLAKFLKKLIRRTASKVIGGGGGGGRGAPHPFILQKCVFVKFDRIVL